MLVGYLLAWIPMVPIAILNGMFRESVLAARMPELRAHQISCVTGILLFAVYVGVLSRLWPFASADVAGEVGAGWLALTVAFEFLFGRLVAHFSWERLLHDYDMGAGRLWPLVLAWVAVSPSVFYHLSR